MEENTEQPINPNWLQNFWFTAQKKRSESFWYATLEDISDKAELVGVSREAVTFLGIVYSHTDSYLESTLALCTLGRLAEDHHHEDLILPLLLAALKHETPAVRYNAVNAIWQGLLLEAKPALEEALVFEPAGSSVIETLKHVIRIFNSYEEIKNMYKENKTDKEETP